jgi:hypothetical protein
VNLGGRLAAGRTSDCFVPNSPSDVTPENTDGPGGGGGYLFAR